MLVRSAAEVYRGVAGYIKRTVSIASFNFHQINTDKVPIRFLLFSGLIVINFCCFAQDKHFSTPLPLVFIDTKGLQIPDDPKIEAHMGIVWNYAGELNTTRDTFNHYNGKISIEIRGSSSQMFPKKSYGFETKDEAMEDMNFPLLGLPEEEDWIFYGPYSDKSLIRNALTFNLAQSLGHYASRTRFVEMFLNNKYQGIYLLMEKIKRDKVRVDIAKLNPDETSGEDLTGGYIIKIDKLTGSGGSGWHSRYSNLNGSSTYYQYEVPDNEEIVPEQMQYIQNYVKAFEDAVYNQKFTGNGSYHDYIDPSSFIDYILLSELTKNIDAYRLSTFLHKDKNGKLKAGPAWDFNLAYGNADYREAWYPDGFRFDDRMEGDNWGNPFWWKGLMHDTAFVNAMKCRWKSLREYSWSADRIIETTDSLTHSLDEAVKRNFERWPVLGQYVWPNYYVASAYPDEIIWMKNWIRNRLFWLDSNLPGKCGGDLNPAITDLQVSLFPNPVLSEINLHIESGTNLVITFKLFNLNGTLVSENQMSITEGEQTKVVDAGKLSKGVYFYQLYKGPAIFQKGKIVKF
jgi:hypothetical protein